jgi:outer membrane receptor protein involved in Fe transport
MRNRQNRVAPGVSVDYAAKYGLTPAVSGQGFPSLGSFGPTGFSGVGYGIGNAAVQIDQNFLFGDDFTWTHGSHLLQFGVDIRRIQSSQYDLSGLTGGRYAFNANSVNGPLGAGSSLGAFVLGDIGGYTNTPQSAPGYYRWHYYAAYFQDDWHVTHKLTLNLGLRYEVETPRVGASSNQGFVRTDMPGTLNGNSFTAAFCFSNGCDGRANLGRSTGRALNHASASPTPPPPA